MKWGPTPEPPTFPIYLNPISPCRRQARSVIQNGPLYAVKIVRKTLSLCITIRKHSFHGYPLILVGYIRVSSDSDRQNTDLQRDALLAAGVDARHLYEDRASGAKDDRSGLAQAVEFVCPGDVLVVWKLDRLGRSLSHLLSIVNALKVKQVAFRSLTEGMDTTTASGELFSICSARLLSTNVR